jgi:hypothetical protein
LCGRDDLFDGAIFVPYFQRLKIARRKSKNLLAETVAAKSSVYYLDEAKMRGECGIIAAAN